MYIYIYIYMLHAACLYPFELSDFFFQFFFLSLFLPIPCNFKDISLLKMKM